MLHRCHECGQVGVSAHLTSTEWGWRKQLRLCFSNRWWRSLDSAVTFWTNVRAGPGSGRVPAAPRLCPPRIWPHTFRAPSVTVTPGRSDVPVCFCILDGNNILPSVLTFWLKQRWSQMKSWSLTASSSASEHQFSDADLKTLTGSSMSPHYSKSTSKLHFKTSSSAFKNLKVSSWFSQFCCFLFLSLSFSTINWQIFRLTSSQTLLFLPKHLG